VQLRRHRVPLFGTIQEGPANAVVYSDLDAFVLVLCHFNLLGDFDRLLKQFSLILIACAAVEYSSFCMADHVWRCRSGYTPAAPQ
jgi:hypothetical protein